LKLRFWFEMIFRKALTSCYVSALGHFVPLKLSHGIFFHTAATPYLTRLSLPIPQQENMVGAGRNNEFIRPRPTRTLLANQECLFRFHLHAIG
jgi:hypothetical protein